MKALQPGGRARPSPGDTVADRARYLRAARRTTNLSEQRYLESCAARLLADTLYDAGRAR